MSDANSEALTLIEAHFNTLEIGSSLEFDSVFSASDVKEYAIENNVNWPGQYVDQNGQSLVIPGMIFFRPAVGFGLGEPNPPLTRAGFFTRTSRAFSQPIRVNEAIHFRGQISDKYLRRGYYYIVVDWTATGPDGAIAATGREWHTLGWARYPETHPKGV